MNQQINNTTTMNAVLASAVRRPFMLKVGLFPMLAGIALLGAAPLAMAANECGAGPTVTCSASSYSSTGITYNFSSDLSILMQATGNLGVGASGVKLNGSGNANLSLTTSSTVWGAGGVVVNMDGGDFTGDIGNSLAATPTQSPSAGGVGFQLTTSGAATLLIRGQQPDGPISNMKLSNLVMDVGRDSTVNVLDRRTIMRMTLSSREGATLTVNNSGVLGDDSVTRIADVNAIYGSGDGDLIINNLVPRSRLASRVDFTGMTGALTINNDYSGNSRQGGWHTRGVSLFGSGDVEIHNGHYGVLRTNQQAVFDFSSTDSAQFFNQGRVMVGATDINSHQIQDHRLTFIGLDRFENAGLMLLGTDFDVTTDEGNATNGKLRERLIFEDSHYVGAGGVIAFDVLLGSTTQTDCVTLTASDCVQFTGTSSTEGTTLLRVRDANPERTVAAFNAGIVMVEGASAAEDFALDPASQFYVPHTSGGAALQKGLIAYRLNYDADTRQHALVGTLADEPVQAATLGASAQEVWRTSTDTWFDRQAAAHTQDERRAEPYGLWASVNHVVGDRSLNRTIAVNGSDTPYNLAQDQDISHVAFGMDLLRGGDGEQTWRGGVTAGLLHSSVDYEATQLQTKMAGLASGLYGSWAMGGLSIDGMFNLNYLRQSVDGANLGQGEHNQLRTQVKSTGLRFEAAWRLPVSETVWLQPLLGASYVTASEGDLVLADDAGGMRFGSDATSLRVGAGLRAGIDSQLAGLRAQYRLTGRYWNERDAENEVNVHVPNESAPIRLVDDYSGNFSDLDGSLSLSNDAGSLSGYVSLKGKFGDDYRSVGGSAGLRYQW
jgi:hypothetical protein